MADLSKLRFNGTDYNVKDASAPLRKFTNYSKTGNLPITSDDTTQTAIGKLEKALDDKINTSAKGTSNGVAELDANGKVPSSQLPSFVDDVLEYSAKSSFPATGETGKIYVDTTTNKTYRWSGSAYVEISESLALGETSSTAYRGDRGKVAYDHSQITNGNPHGTTGANTNLTGYSKGSSKDAVAATDTVNAAIAKHENRINANQSNILYTINTGAWNLCPAFLTKFTKDGVTLTSDSTGVHVTGTQGQHTDGFSDVTQFVLADEKSVLKAGTYVFSGTASDAGYSQHRIHFVFEDGTYVMLDTANPVTQTFSADKVLTRIYVYLRYPVGTVYNLNLTPMIVDKRIWDTLGHDYHEPSLPNYDLTRLEAEDRASLAEVVDSGAKNLFPVTRDEIKSYNSGFGWNGYTATNGGITFTLNADGTITLNGTTTATMEFSLLPRASGKALFKSAGNYVLYCAIPSQYAGTETFFVGLNRTVSGSGVRYGIDNGNGLEFTVSASETSAANGMWIGFSSAGITLNNVTIKPMLCTKAAFGVSNKFVPYRVPINGVFWAEKYEARSTTLVSTGIKFTASKQTIYRITATAQYGNSKPTQLVIKKKLIPSESEGNFVAVSSDTNSQSLTATGIMTLGVGGYFEVYAAYDGTTSNRVYAIVEEVVL